MYIDPPYPENGCNYVHNMREKKDHQLLAAKLHQARCRWVLSSYDTPFIRDLFAGCTIIPLESKSGMNTEKNGTARVTNKEVVILNYIPPDDVQTAILSKGEKIRKAEQVQQKTLLEELFGQNNHAI